MNKLQEKINKCFTDSFGRTPLEERLIDLKRECWELINYKDLQALKDLWTLLSDGKLPFVPDVDRFMAKVFNRKYLKIKDKFESSSVPKALRDVAADVVGDDEEESLSYYSLKELRRDLRLDVSLEEMAKWDSDVFLNIALEKIKNHQIYEAEDYSKLLIIISGNLDEAFCFCKETSETDLDADLFYRKSLSVNILDVKKALTSKFRSEQIARFGNIHIIYPSINKDSYKKIITRKIEEVMSNTLDRFSVKITVDKTIEALIYNNGVFPVQGTRPLFSTIKEIIESSLPTFLFECFMKDMDSFTMTYDGESICALFENEICKIPYTGSLDRTREGNKEPDKQAIVSVHEGGHALAHALVFGVTPPQVNALTNDRNLGGFVIGQKFWESIDFVLRQITVALAGRAAELIVFGDAFTGTGSARDLKEATKEMAYLIRNTGYHPHILSTRVCESDNNAIEGNTDLDPTNDIIEKAIQEIANKAKTLIKDRLPLFKELVSYLYKNHSITPYVFCKLCASHNLHIDLKDDIEEELCPEYKDKLDFFLSSK